MTWSPTDGLRRAEPIVHQLEQEADATGAHLSPLFRYRMLQVFAAELDRAMAQPHLDFGPEPPIVDNGRWEMVVIGPNGPMTQEEYARVAQSAPASDLAPVFDPALAQDGPIEPPVPRKRGRPKGPAKKAKGKRGKPAVEAAAVDLPEAAP